MILHHYEMSPFSEKIRALFGYTNMSWQSAISPPMPPRPTIDPLSGGYRRIPIAQIGADIFCDTRIICAEIAALSGIHSVDPKEISPEEAEFIYKVDHAVFMAMAASPKPAKVLRLLFGSMTPWTAARFLIDRSNMTRNMTIKRVSRRRSNELLAEFFKTLEGRLNHSKYLFGEEPGLADFCAYHVVWFGGMINSLSFLNSLPSSKNWYHRMQGFGHGKRENISRKQVFAAAANAEPRPLSGLNNQHHLAGRSVVIGPDDYAQDQVTGLLVQADNFRYVLQRDSNKFGRLHVHFPVQGYLIKEAQ